jgi:hypothetical protein
MVLSSARPFSPAPPEPAGALLGLADDLVDLRHRVCDEHGILSADYGVLKALVATPDATKEELAVAAHCSPVGTLAAIDRLHRAGYAKPRAHAAQGGGPVATDSGRLMVAGIDGTIELALGAPLGATDDHARSWMSRMLDACRTAVWESGASPVVAVLDPE